MRRRRARAPERPWSVNGWNTEPRTANPNVNSNLNVNVYPNLNLNLNLNLEPNLNTNREVGTMKHEHRRHSPLQAAGGIRRSSCDRLSPTTVTWRRFSASAT